MYIETTLYFHLKAILSYLIESLSSWEAIVGSCIVNVIQNIWTLFVEFHKNIFQKFRLEDIFNSPEMEQISVSQNDT